ncbi:class I SAM-dependent methyltransferase [Nostoc parmelioides]|uniref:class I SAM-dependent methyltransferase n=1 Tax=Nostoc parmelioides TaxID=1521621 RepID=UPI001F54AD45|nr:class I SAM-dependent methyltransferase [Nostoc parmelioides]
MVQPQENLRILDLGCGTGKLTQYLHETLAAKETAKEFSQELGGYTRRLEVLTPSAYAKLLYKLGFVQQQVKLQMYGHVLPLREAVVEWYRGTLLTAYESQLDSQTYEQFVQSYQQKLFQVLPDEHPFFFPYKWILMWGKI